MARPDSLGGMPEDEMMAAEGGGEMDMGGEMDALVGEVIGAAMPGIEAAIREALNSVLLGGGGEEEAMAAEGGGRPAGLM